MGNEGVPHYHLISMVLQAVLLVGSAALTIQSILGLHVGRRGYRGVLVWVLSVPLYVAWRQLSPGLPMSDEWHRVSHDFRLAFAGAIVTYGITYIVPFLGRDSKAWKAERKRARQEAESRKQCL